MYEYLKTVIATANNICTIYVRSWTSKGLSNEEIKASNTSTNNDQALILEYERNKFKIQWRSFKAKQSHTQSWTKSKHFYCLQIKYSHN